MPQPALLDETFDPAPFLADADYCAEEKLNGRRLMLVKRGGVVRCYSRNGVEFVAPLDVVNTARRMSGDVILDGELVGCAFVPFDVLDFCGLDVTGEPFRRRREMLCAVSPFPVVAHATGERDKRALLDWVCANDGEGVVFKRLDGVYSPGSRCYGVKLKFYQTATCEVGDVCMARSSIGLVRGGRDCGRVRFNVNATWPKVGELWEVRFDEVSRNGKLMRPVLLMRRDDLDGDVLAAAAW